MKSFKDNAPKGKIWNPLTRRYKKKTCPKYQILDTNNTGDCKDKLCENGKAIHYETGRCRKRKKTRKKNKKNTSNNENHSSAGIVDLTRIHPDSNQQSNQLPPPIPPEDFFIDPCYVFNKMKTNIRAWNNNTYQYIMQQIPIVAETSPQNYHYKENTIKIKKKINESTYGEIYDGLYNKHKVVIKLLKRFKAEEFINEYYIHTTLFCHQRAMQKEYQHTARIPKIEFVVRYRDPNASNNRYKYMIGMEYLEGDLAKKLENTSKSSYHPPYTTNEVLYMLIKVANLPSALHFYLSNNVY